MHTPVNQAPDLESVRPSPLERARRNRLRRLRDTLARHAIFIGGAGVIFAIVLIFVYLFSVVVPLFKPASMDAAGQYASPGGGEPTMLLALEEQNEVGVRIDAAGQAWFFDVADGSLRSRIELELPAGARITTLHDVSRVQGSFLLGLDNGQVVYARHRYKTTYPEGERLITPEIDYPLGAAPLTIDPTGAALTAVAAGDNETRFSVLAATADGRVILARFDKEVSFLDESVTIEEAGRRELALAFEPDFLLMTTGQDLAYVAHRDGRVEVVETRSLERAHVIQHLIATDNGAEITRFQFLLGGISLLIADSSGEIGQWFQVRQDSGDFRLQRIRSFAGDAAVTALDTEQRRKGFLVADRDGAVHIYHSTAHRHLLSQTVTSTAPETIALSPRANTLLVEDAERRIHVWKIDNEHPEVSVGALWAEVWYESFPEPEYLWQSSAANNDFEPKFSLMPLTFGTLKAAFYAMLVAMPLAIMGAIFTAYFMAPRMRKTVKPSIEVMEALPTVILGFLAGLWFAPYAEENLVGIFSVLLLMPILILLFGYLWGRVPGFIRYRIPDGWQAALLIPVVILGGWACILAGPILEVWFFDGDMRGWLNQQGIGFDQRNALVVGLAMGFAVIPTIFSISEDAIFSVPKHLTQGSLALGATPWQTLARVVLPTASPGLFSAVMIGLGRAVGETMIVLMATGNTPVMDFSVFEGMRTLAANIAVELPESEVDSSHYRILFLAALVLFILTFAVNTLAEIVRQRLRNKYSRI